MVKYKQIDNCKVAAVNKYKNNGIIFADEVYLPHNAPHSISDLNLCRYFLISGSYKRLDIILGSSSMGQI